MIPLRILLIGEMNPYGADPAMALYPLPEHASGGRLAKILRLTAQQYLRAFDRVNLLTGDRWSIPKARQAAKALTHPWRILLGAKVCAAHGVRFVPFFLAPVAEYRALVLPHPSGLNRIWNAETEQRALAAVQWFRNDFQKTQ